MYGFTNQQRWCEAFIPHCSWERTLISVIIWPQVCPLRMTWAEELGVCGTQSDSSSSAFCREHMLCGSQPRGKKFSRKDSPLRGRPDFSRLPIAGSGGPSHFRGL